MTDTVIPAKAGIQSSPTWAFLTRAVLWGCLLAADGPASAAGGHHAVDDAAILGPGACELESWFTHTRNVHGWLHAGAACRVGPIELGVGSEYVRPRDAGSETAWGVQGKWAQEVGAGLSLGLSLTPVWGAHMQPRFLGTTVSGLATWAAAEQWALHLNLGRDYLHRAEDESRYGVAAEWSGSAGWSLVAGRFKEARTHYLRAGARWAFAEQWSTDLSYAYRLAGPRVSNWTLGVTYLLERR